MIRTLGALVGAPERAERLADDLARRALRRRNGGRATRKRMRWRPKVYFEEWDEPMISGIAWVSELIAAAGGDDVFADLCASQIGQGSHRDGATRSSPRAPDVIIGSWCGKKFRPEKVAARPGFAALPAVRQRRRLRDQVAADPAAGAGGADRRTWPRIQAIIAQRACD